MKNHLEGCTSYKFPAILGLHLYGLDDSGKTILKEAENINPYLIGGPSIVVAPQSNPLAEIAEMNFGNMPNEGGHLLLDAHDAASAIASHGVQSKFIRPFVGSQEFIRGTVRRCIWVTDDDAEDARSCDWLRERFDAVRKKRAVSGRATTKQLAAIPHRFGEVRQIGNERTIVVPAISSENRDYLPCGLLPAGNIVSNKCYALYDAPLWNMALIASRLHWVWIGTVCVRMRTDFSYSNTLGWNTFPVPMLTERNRADLTRCAEDILLAREAHFPATIADLYDPKTMPDNLHTAHDRNDEVLERIYIGRRFRNDTERLEKLFAMYTQMAVRKGDVNEIGFWPHSMSG